MKLFVVGLRRSGTTIFWEMFRRDSRLLCYDEPYNPKLALLPESHPKGTWTEFVRLYERDPALFRSHFAPIAKEEELRPGLTPAQESYLRWLLSQGEHLAIDFTRCHYKLESLHSIAPDAVLVHLHRRPESVATSHLLPGGNRSSVRQQVVDWARRMSFWWRRSWYDNWGFETIIGTKAEGLAALRLREVGVNPGDVYAGPAVARLMAFWYAAYCRVEMDGPRVFGRNFLSVAYEDFCADPRAVLRKVYSVCGMNLAPDFDTSGVRTPKAPYQAGSSKWSRTFQGLARSGARLEHAGDPISVRQDDVNAQSPSRGASA